MLMVKPMELLVNAQILKTPDGKPVRCLYVCCIPSDAKEDDLLAFFRSYGDVKTFFLKKRVYRESFSKSTFAFVTFAAPEEAFRLYSNRTTLRFRGRKLFVSIADTWYQPTVGPDGTIDFNPRASNRQTTVQNESVDIEEEDEVEEDTPEDNFQTCPIAKLNDDCLMQIIELVPFSERHVLSCVNRRWRNLMSLYWSKITQLDFNVRPFNKVEFSEKCLERYLRLCPNIRSVHLVNKDLSSSCIFQNFTSQSIVKTAMLCPRLEELVLTGIELANRPLATVAHCCRGLKSLTIKTCMFIESDNEMNAVMKRCSQLEALKMSNCHLKPALWLSNLRPGLKSLSLLCCEMNHNHFLRGLDKVKESLEELNLIIDICSDPLDFNKLRNFSKLERITYVNRSVHPQRTFADMFRNLKTLELEFNTFLSDELLKGIVVNCPALGALNIASCKDHRLTSEGFKAIADLSQLVKLNLSKNNVDDEVLETLALKSKKLEILSVNMCSAITDWGCKKVVQNLPKLRELHLDSCLNVTNKTVYAAVKAASHQPDKASLTIYMFQTDITVVQVNPHPKVQLCSVNQSELKWLLCGSLHDFSDFFLEDDMDDEDDDDDDDDDFEFEMYDEDDIYDPSFELHLFDWEQHDFLEELSFDMPPQFL